MKMLLATLILLLSSPAYSEENFENKIYTPEVVVDSQNEGPKGAVQLLWQKDPNATRYEVEVSNGNLVYSQVGEKHFHHVMIYFDKDYQWRVREVSARKTTEFSPWMPLKVVRGQDVARVEKPRVPQSVETDRSLDEVILDAGGGDQ